MFLQTQQRSNNSVAPLFEMNARVFSFLCLGRELIAKQGATDVHSVFCILDREFVPIKGAMALLKCSSLDVTRRVVIVLRLHGAAAFKFMRRLIWTCSFGASTSFLETGFPLHQSISTCFFRGHESAKLISTFHQQCLPCLVL